MSSESVTTAPTDRPVGRLAMRNPKASFARDVARSLNYRLAPDTLGRELTADADWVQGTDATHQDFPPLTAYPPEPCGGSSAARKRAP